MARRSAKPVEAAPVEPPANHNAAYTDDQLIAENFKLEDLIKQAIAKLEEWAKPHKERIKEIEAEIFQRLNSRGADSTRTDSGTAYFSTIMNSKVEDREKLFDYIADNWETVGADVQLNLAKDAVRTHMDEHDGMVPPGMSISHFKRLNIKRS